MTAGEGEALLQPPRAELDRAVRRNTLLLALAQGLLYATLPLLLVVGTVAIVDQTGRETWVGIYTGAYFLAAATGAFLLGRVMDRLGRRPGLALGHLLVGLSGIASALAVRAGSPLGLVAAGIPFGLGAGGALLGRGATAEMYPPERRGRAVGLVLAASTVGAVGSPPLVAAIQRWAEGAGFDRLVAPWFVIPVVEVAAVACVLALRPDPRDLARTVAAGSGAVAETAASKRGPRELLALRPFRAAVVAAAVGQAAMIAVMGAAPVVVHQHGGSGAAVSGVISGHFLGMFALAPFVGAALDRWGRRRGLLWGAGLSAAGALGGSLLTGTAVIGIGLFLVGLGWCAAYLGATAVISDVTGPAERGGALGFTDLLVSLSSGAGGFLGGVLLEAGGFGAVGVLVAVALVPVVLLTVPLREPSPGRWALAAVRVEP